MECLKGIFTDLCRRTKDYPFSKAPGEPENVSDHELRRFRLKALIYSVRAMAVKKFYEMPEGYRSSFPQELWIQEAYRILLELAASYNEDSGPSFNQYVGFLTPRRLIDVQRSVFRENPPVEKDMRRLTSLLRRDLGRQPTATELSHFTGVSIEEAQRYLDEGSLTRVFQTESDGLEIDNFSEGDADRPESSPEEFYLRKELLLVIGECLDGLDWYEKYIIMQFYFEEKSYKEISAMTLDSTEAIRNRCKRALPELFKCVRKRYDVHPDLAHA